MITRRGRRSECGRTFFRPPPPKWATRSTISKIRKAKATKKKTNTLMLANVATRPIGGYGVKLFMEWLKKHVKSTSRHKGRRWTAAGKAVFKQGVTIPAPSLFSGAANQTLQKEKTRKTRPKAPTMNGSARPDAKHTCLKKGRAGGKARGGTGCSRPQNKQSLYTALKSRR